MRKYEIVYIVDGALSEEEAKAVVERFTEYTESNAQLEKIEEWGKKRFAYLINKKSDGYYVLMEVSATPEFPGELERMFKITENILKYLIISKEK